MPPAAVLGDWTAPDGWRHRRFDLAAERARGRLLFQGGRSDVFEKYLEAIGHLHARGWSVTSFDWRGQGGSGRLSPDPRVGHATDFSVFVRDLAAFWAEWTAEGEGPHVVLGHSMGGHMTLRALAEGAIDPAGAILSAPMIRVRSPFGAWASTRIARYMAGKGDPARPAWKWSDEQTAVERRRRRLTLDNARGQDERWWYDDKPDLELGPPSWAWIAEAFAAGAALENDPRLERVRTPVLMLVADADKLVDARASFRVAAKLPRCELVRFGAAESAHEILRESLPVQARAFATIDDFLDRMAGRG
ncbi:alpha/beta fold hydrolase [Sphingomonas lenta]|uniref:alpha/beta fold hydrolase n=1 Tax=Sphingomonas lenta TaxID=1141887 RepID=UPI001FE6BB31|nr:alpha/beta hydrolase [Sphingomonas lenta]